MERELMDLESSKAWESEWGQQLRTKLAMLEDAFTDIRDHKEATAKISGKADFGQGRVADLKSFLFMALQKKA
jgi:hypothetical protein